MTDNIGLRIVLTAQNLANPIINNAVQGLMGVSPVLGGVAVAATAVGAAVIGIGAVAVKMASDYQTAMTQLQNTTGSSDSQMQQYAATIRSLSDTTGKAQTDLAKGMYQIISANFAGADATRILTTATKAAIIAGADQTQVTTGLVVTLNAFGLKASQVDTISNQMFKTLSLGRGQMNDLAGALQTGGALVAHYHVSVKDMDATLATLSTGGMKTFGTSMTGLTQLLNVMDGKTDLITKRIHKLGISFDENKFKAMTYTQQVAYLSKAFEGHEQQMVSVLGSKQAATALGILGTQAPLLASNLQKLGDTQQLAKEKTTAWAKAQGDAAFQWQKLVTVGQNFLIDIGMKLLPVLSSLMSKITPIITAFITWVAHSGILDKIMQVIGIDLSLLGKEFGLLWPLVQQAAKAVIQFGEELWSRLKPIIANITTWIKQNWSTIIGVFQGAFTIIIGAVKTAWAIITGIFKIALDIISGNWGQAWTDLKDMVGNALQGIWQIIQGAGELILNALKAPFIAARDFIGNLFSGLGGMIHNSLANMPLVGGALHTLHIPGFASGGITPGGPVLVGERGPELLSPPGGSRVTPLGGGHTFIFNVSINTMAGSRSEIQRLTDLFEAEIAARFRSQTGNYASGGTF